jgi:beta-lactam-binding protein with PASTA domain
MVVLRDNRWELDNGNCESAIEVVYDEGFGPKQTAGCKQNEVDVPHVVGLTLQDAEDRLAGMPLTPQVITRPAKAGERLGIVVSQFPRGGTLSSWDTVRIVLPKAIGGLVPRVVGLTLLDARSRLERRHLVPFVEAFANGKPGVVLAQSPRGRRAALRGLIVKLVVGRG